MKGDPKVLDYLNEALKNELTAINQYWLHYRLLDNWGVTKLAELERHESIDERLRIGETVEEILKADLAVEMEAIPLLRDAIQHCESVRDYVSRDLFADILESEEEHVDTLEKQFDMIARMGIANYIQLNSEPAEAS